VTNVATLFLRVSAQFGAPVFRRLMRNASKLLGANMFASLLGLLASAAVARSLGASQFGVFALVLAYAAVLDTLVNFQSWQALIKYGAEDLKAGDAPTFSSLVKFGTLLDATCACIGTVLAVLLVPLVAPWLGVEADQTQVFLLYSVVILSRMTATPTAVLRLFDRFDILALQNIVVGCTRVCFVGIAFVLRPSLGAFLLAWGAAEVLGNLLLVARSWGELRSRGYAVMRSSAGSAPRSHSGLWSFVWTSNLHSTLKLGLREGDVLALGALAGPSAAGLYKVIKQVESIASRAIAPLTQVIYPEIAAAAASADRARIFKLLRAVSLLAAGVFGALLLLFWLAGEPAIRLVLGEAFMPAFEPGLVYLTGTLLSAATLAFQPAALALGMPQRSLRVLFAATMVYVFAFGALGYRFGLVGAAGAYVIFYVTWSLLMIRLLRNGLRRLGGVDPNVKIPSVVPLR
jgi:O-antigen/teichoic acid export membrane protein